MKTLAQYLAEYIDYEHDKGNGLFFVGSYPDGSIYFEMDCLQEIIEQGIEAYQSTENCTIMIIEQAQQQEELLDAAKEIVRDFNRYGEVLQTGDNGEYGMDSAIGRLNAIVNQIEEG